MGAGAAAGDAGNFVFGGGLALLDNGAARVELLGRLGITGGQRVRLDGSGGVTGSGSVQRFSFLAELALAARRGRLEPWISGGLATTGTEGKFDYFCNSSESPACIASSLQSGTDTFEGSWSGGATVAGGVRYAFTDSLLVEAELRYSKRGESRFEDVPISVTVGGLSGTLSALWRFELATLPRRPTPGPAPIGVAARCASGQPPVFVLHPLRRFRCFPDPVRGGFFCGEPAQEAEFSDPGGCARACRSGSDACPSGGASGAACDRCVAACAQGRSVACSPGNRGSPEGEGCRLEAGAWGATDSVVVPASCPVVAPER